MTFKQMLSIFCVYVISGPVLAEVYWSDFSLSYLNGSDFEVGDPKRQTLTVEHASGMSWGDNFFFIDHQVAETGAVTQYFELAPRISLSSLTKSKLAVGPFKDFYIATTLEGGSFTNYLLGVGVSLAIPGFKYFNVNLYNANNEKIDNDEQITLTWAVPFGTEKIPFIYDGFLDYSTKGDDHAAEMNFTSQLKWNFGKLMNLKAPLYLGIEYAYWTNKYGIDGVDEKNPNLLLKWHF